MTIRLKPLAFAEAAMFVRQYHRHHTAPQGWKFGIGAVDDQGTLWGVVTVGRPLARRSDTGYTAEVTRLCVREDAPAYAGHANSIASMLYAAAWRAAKAMGYTRMLTFILDSEPGTSLKAAGWHYTGDTPGQSWSVPSRQRVDKHPVGLRHRWEITA